jgi:hypothetical protein
MEIPIICYDLGFPHQVHNKLEELAQKHCYGCEIAHPSQTQHSFLMCSEMEHFHMYGDQAYQDVIENDTITIWLDVIYPATSLWEEMKYSFLTLIRGGKAKSQCFNIFFVSSSHQGFSFCELLSLKDYLYIQTVSCTKNYP